jgi:hypothetical protein
VKTGKNRSSLYFPLRGGGAQKANTGGGAGPQPCSGGKNSFLAIRTLYKCGSGARARCENRKAFPLSPALIAGFFFLLFTQNLPADTNGGGQEGSKQVRGPFSSHLQSTQTRNVRGEVMLADSRGEGGWREVGRGC